MAILLQLAMNQFLLESFHFQSRNTEFHLLPQVFKSLISEAGGLELFSKASAFLMKASIQQIKFRSLLSYSKFVFNFNPSQNLISNSGNLKQKWKSPFSCSLSTSSRSSIYIQMISSYFLQVSFSLDLSYFLGFFLFLIDSILALHLQQFSYLADSYFFIVFNWMLSNSIFSISF